MGAAAVVLTASAISSCGGTTEADQVLQDNGGKSLTAEDQLVERNLITSDDLSRVPAGSVKHAFLSYWSAISYQEWSVAAEFLGPELRDALKPAYLPATFDIEGQTALPQKPMIRDVIVSRGQTAVRYFVRDGSGELDATSMTWVKQDGDWYIVYSPTLDASYAAAVQQATQNEIDPTASTPSKAAIRAGARAKRAQAGTLAAPTAVPPATTSAPPGP